MFLTSYCVTAGSDTMWHKRNSGPAAASPEFLTSNNDKDIVKSIVDGLASLLNGNGYVDTLGIAEATEYNYFHDDVKKQ